VGVGKDLMDFSYSNEGTEDGGASFENPANSANCDEPIDCDTSVEDSMRS